MKNSSAIITKGGKRFCFCFFHWIASIIAQPHIGMNKKDKYLVLI